MFAPLNTKTEYSFLDSVVKVDDYLKTAAPFRLSNGWNLRCWESSCCFSFCQKSSKI